MSFYLVSMHMKASRVSPSSAQGSILLLGLGLLGVNRPTDASSGPLYY